MLVNMLKTLIIIGILAVILLMFLSLLGTTATRISTDTACKESVRLHARIVAENPNDAAAKIKCPLQFVDVREKREAGIKKVFADAMASCYDQYLRGEQSLFGLTEDHFCAPCTVLSFDRDNIVFAGMDQFMEVTESKYTKDGKPVTYAKFFGGEATELSSIDTSKRYVIIFSVVKDVKWYAGNLQLLDLVLNQRGWTLADQESSIIVAEYDEDALSKLPCERVPSSQTGAQ